MTNRLITLLLIDLPREVAGVKRSARAFFVRWLTAQTTILSFLNNYCYDDYYYYYYYFCYLIQSKPQCTCLFVGAAKAISIVCNLMQITARETVRLCVWLDDVKIERHDNICLSSHLCKSQTFRFFLPG